MPPRPSNDWPAVLTLARQLVEDATDPPTMPELWQALVDCGACDASDRHWSGFRHQVREASMRGEFPILPRAKSGPAKGTYRSDRRIEAEEDVSPWELMTERRAQCLRYLRAAVLDEGSVLLTPSVFAEMAEQGWGELLVFSVLDELRAAGVVQVRRADHLRAGFTLEIGTRPVRDRRHDKRARRQLPATRGRERGRSARTGAAAVPASAA